MGRWSRLLIVSLLLALALTAGFRFIQHTDDEYAFWVATFGAVATQLEARCAASKLAEVCARAKERRAFAEGFRVHHNRVMAWWWPVLLAMALAWAAALISVIALVRTRNRNAIRNLPRGKPEN